VGRKLRSNCPDFLDIQFVTSLLRKDPAKATKSNFRPVSVATLQALLAILLAWRRAAALQVQVALAARARAACRAATLRITPFLLLHHGQM